MYNYKIKTSFVSSEMSQARAIKNGFNIMIVHFYIHRKLDIMIRYMIFQSGLEPVLIQRLIGFEVIMDISSVLGRGMRELKIGDRFWYENAGMKNSFTPG